jgi:hypothetical protein
LPVIIGIISDARKRKEHGHLRIVFDAKDRGCSHPGCEVSGYYCEVHHVTGYAKCRTTDVNDLTFGCGGHHTLIEPGGWKTRKLTALRPHRQAAGRPTRR